LQEGEEPEGQGEAAMKDIERFLMEGEKALAGRDWEAYGSFFSEDLVMRTPSQPGIAIGREARVELAKGIFEAFPDGRVDPEGYFQDGDWACARWRFTGTHTGPFGDPDQGGIPPTGKAVDFSYCMVLRFEDGKAVELHEFYDQLEMLTQLGVA
jgi:predicted ester cyclase